MYARSTVWLMWPAVPSLGRIFRLPSSQTPLHYRVWPIRFSAVDADRSPAQTAEAQHKRRQEERHAGSTGSRTTSSIETGTWADRDFRLRI